VLATILSDARRYDEALAACRPPAWGDHPPLHLRGRAAWVEACRGNTKEAIAAMRLLLDEDPRYSWAIQQLAQWYRDSNDLSAYREMSQRMVELSPNRALSHGYLGHACELLKDRAPAKAAYRRAIEIDPSYRFGGMSLFDLQMEDKEYDEAGHTLDVLLRYPDDGYVAARQVHLAVRMGDVPLAVTRLKTMCGDDNGDGGALTFAFDAFDSTRDNSELEKMLLEMCLSDAVNPTAGALWAKLNCRHKRWRKTQRTLDAMRGSDGKRAVALAAAPVILKAMAKHYIQQPNHSLNWARGASKRRLRRFIDRRADWLRPDLACWAEVCYCLVTLGLYRKNIRWSDDWQTRSSVGQAALINRIISLLSVNRQAEATKVAYHAMSLRDGDRHQLPKLLVALSEVLDHQPQSAADRIREIDMKKSVALDRFLRELVEAALSVSRSTAASQSPRSLKAARRHLAKARLTMPKFRRTRSYRKSYLRIVEHIVAAHPTFMRRLWGMHRIVHQRPW
jgi:tetratricopeptide (TPR) repeat protein